MLLSTSSITSMVNWELPNKNMQGKQRSHYKIKRRKLLAKVKGNKRGEDSPLNPLPPERFDCIKSDSRWAPNNFKRYRYRQGLYKHRGWGCCCWAVRGKGNLQGKPRRAGVHIPSPRCLLSHQPRSCRAVSHAGLGGREGQLYFRKYTNPSILEAFKTASCAVHVAGLAR